MSEASGVARSRGSDVPRTELYSSHGSAFLCVGVILNKPSPQVDMKSLGSAWLIPCHFNQAGKKVMPIL